VTRRAPLRAFVAFGANLDPRRHIARGLEELARATRLLRVSRVFRTPPLARPEQPDFRNGAVLLETDLPPRKLKFQVLRRIERELGRVRGADPHQARTLDLDLVLYADLVLREEGLVLPDPEIRERLFLAIPLLDLDPDLVLPGSEAPLSAQVPPGREGELPLDEPFTRFLQERWNR